MPFIWRTYAWWTSCCATINPPRAREILTRYQPQAGEDDLREFAWYHLIKRCQGERRTLTGHRDEVYHVEYSRRGDLLASTGKDGMVLIWDTSAWKVIRTIPSQGTECNVAAFSPDGKTLVTSGDDGLVRIWEIASGNLLHTLSAHPGKEGSVQFLPDGRSLLTGAYDGLVKRWDARTGVEVEQFRIEGSPLMCMALSPDGSILAAGGRGGTRLWNLARRSLIKVLAGQDGRVLDAAFSHDGKRVATAGEGDHAIRLYEVPSGRSIRTFQGHGRDVRSVKFVADDSLLVSCSDDLTIRTWDVASGSQQAVVFGHTEPHLGAFSLTRRPDGRIGQCRPNHQSLELPVTRRPYQVLRPADRRIHIHTRQSDPDLPGSPSLVARSVGCGCRHSHWA